MSLNTTSTAGIELRQVSKRYGSAADGPWAVRDLSLVVPRGSLTTILGPSGCGKTTTLRLIAGLEQASGGQIWIAGRDVTTLGPAERNLSMMFQSYALFPHMNVWDNVGYGLRVSGLAPAVIRERAAAMLDSVGLQGLGERLPSELSGGQQQRVALARALVLEPEVLLFDEPLSNLDARLRREMRDEIRALQQRLGLTVAYVTHDQSEALAVSDHILVMQAGALAQHGSPQELYRSPANAFVASFMGEAVLFDAEVINATTVQLGPIQVALVRPETSRPLSPGRVQLAVRPEAWRIGAPGQGVAARLKRSAYLGSGYEYTFETAQLGSIFVLSQAADAVLPPGAEVGLQLSPYGVAVLGQ